MGKRVLIQGALLLETYTTTEKLYSSRVKTDFKAMPISRLDGDLERSTAVHLVERALVILELEHVRNLQERDRVSIVDTALS